MHEQMQMKKILQGRPSQKQLAIREVSGLAESLLLRLRHSFCSAAQEEGRADSFGRGPLLLQYIS